MNTPRYTIIESDIGPLISKSRVTVYDVMKDYDDGDNIYFISDTYNLSPLQVETAVEYIKKHREVLEPELAEILVKKAERERDYRAQAAKIKTQIAQSPMTPKRAKLQALLERSRRIRKEMEGGSNDIITLLFPIYHNNDPDSELSGSLL